jgi:hypothetical protein
MTDTDNGKTRPCHLPLVDPCPQCRGVHEMLPVYRALPPHAEFWPYLSYCPVKGTPFRFDIEGPAAEAIERGERPPPAFDPGPPVPQPEAGPDRPLTPAGHRGLRRFLARLRQGGRPIGRRPLRGRSVTFTTASSCHTPSSTR